jgi:cobalt/nickel transport system permease protein
MHHEYLDRYARASSQIHRLSSTGKVAAAALTVALIIVAPVDWLPLYLVLVCCIGMIVALSGIPLRFILTRLLIAEPFVIGVGFLALIQPEGFVTLLKIFIKSNLCLLTILLLSNTTPFSSLLDVLERVKVPRLFISILALMYRYIFLLLDQTERMRRARKSRGGGMGLRKSWRSAAGIVGQLFVRSVDRAERVYAAMTARGWE